MPAPKLAFQCGQEMARIHNVDVNAAGLAPVLRRFDPADYLAETWDRCKEMPTPQPMIDYAARWLSEQLSGRGSVDLTLVHNDFRNGKHHGGRRCRPDRCARLGDRSHRRPHARPGVDVHQLVALRAAGTCRSAASAATRTCLPAMRAWPATPSIGIGCSTGRCSARSGGRWAAWAWLIATGWAPTPPWSGQVSGGAARSASSTASI